jgi:hypothetical protein
MIVAALPRPATFDRVIKPDGSKRDMNIRAVLVTTAGLVTLISGVVHADPRQDVLEAMGRCSAITDDKGRLGCYDALSPHLRDALNTPPAALSGPPTKDEEKSWFGFNLDGLFGSAAAQQTTPQQFGAENTPQVQQKVEAAQQELDSISAGVTEYSFTFDKKFIVFLDNGQVWRQIQGDPAEAKFSRNPKDNTVTIDRGMIGSYNLKINDSLKTFKVTRVK